MAKKKGSAKKKKAISVEIAPDSEIVSERIYSNYVDILYSPYDCTLRFCDVQPIRNFNTEADGSMIHQVPVVAEIAIPHQMLPSLIKALQSQYKEYTKNYVDKSNGRKSKDK